ncbi:MAG: HEAT repeat domain-containing protein [Deltaproteobacteria bacterium]|nr:HEAT repeat domain-containing protein [Deltaproteobacteria bacterium]
MSGPLTTETILIEFAKTVKAIGFYPEGHPNLEAFIEKTFNLLKDAINEKGYIKWLIERTGFMEERLAIGKGRKPLEALAKDLFFKRIREINFTQDATLKEWKDFLSILKMDTDSLKKAGGLEKLLLIKEIKGIELNEMNYADIRKKVIEIEEAKKKEELETGQEEEAAAEAESEEKEEVVRSMEEQLKAIEESEETIEVLLDKLEKEENTMLYKTIAHKIMEKTKPLQEEKNMEGLFPVLITLTAHSGPESRRLPEQKDIASMNLKSLLYSDMTAYLIIRLCSRHEERRKEIQQILILSGEEAMKQLLTALVNRDEAYSRRQIFNALIMFGEMVRLEAEKCLDDERWFVVRQMVSLLGEIGSPRSLQAIKTAFGHKDVRIKKEVLKAVAKIPSNESTAFLLERLLEDNAALKYQVIISLGVLKDPAAVEPLGDFALKRDFFNEEIEFRKEAARSLGMIGGKSATAILKNLLQKKVFWGKKQNDEVRSVAAISLGRIGGKDAIDLLEEMARTSKGIVHIACKKAMEGIK